MINKHLRVMLPSDCYAAIEHVLGHELTNASIKDRLVYITSLIYYKQIQDEKNCGENYVFLKAEFLKSVLGNSYKKYMDLLVTAEIILSRTKYQPKVHSRSYLINPGLESYEVKWYTITDKRIKTKHWQYQTKTSMAAKRKYSYLIKWIKYLELDTENAKTYLEQLNLEASRGNDPKSKNKCRNMNSILNNFDVLKSRHVIGKKGNRLFTVISFLPKELRRFILFDKKHLVSVDLSNSQPYLLLWLFTGDPQFKKNQKKIFKGSRIQFNKLYSLMIPLLAKTQYSKEFQRYKNLVCGGGFYEHFIPSYTKKNGMYGLAPEKIKKAVKLDVLKSLYSKNSMPIGNGIKTQLHKNFPKISSVLNMIRKPKYQALAIILQRIESYLVLDVICKRIYKERPDVPIFSLHDSIVTTIGNEDYIKSVMEDELKIHIGEAPMIKYEYWR